VFDRAGALAQSLLLGLLAVAVVVTERSVTRGGRHRGRLAAGARALRVPLGRWRGPAVALVAGVVGLALVAPVGVLAFWAVRGLFLGSSRAGALVTDAGALAVPAANTAVMAMLAALVAVAAVLPVAYLTVRHASRLAGGANAVIVGGFALPGLVVALALAFWTLQAPWPLAALYQTQALLVFAYVVHFGSQALRAAQVAVATVPGRLDDAARTLGAGRLRRLCTIELPLAAPGLLAGAGLVLLSTMKELPATLLLAPPGFETLATRIWNATEDAFLADASLAALALLLLSGVLTFLLVVRHGDAPT
jgi:iron(III) transport system permease protein